MTASVSKGSLSSRDRLCLEIAKAETAILYTNDKPLLNAALSDGVDARWGLTILLEMVEKHAIEPRKALDAARGICGRARFPGDALLKQFEEKLKAL